MTRVKKYTRNQSTRAKHPSHSKGNRSFGDVLMLVITISAAMMLVVSYLSIFVNPSLFPSLAFFGLYFIPILLLNLIILLILLLNWKKSMFISIIAILPSLFFVELFYKTYSDNGTIDGKPIKLITYNVGGFWYRSNSLNFSEISNFAENQNPDIVCFQEYSVADTADVAKYLDNMPYNHHFFHTGSRYSGNITFSKYPIVDSGVLSFPESNNLCIWCDLVIDGITVRIYNCHLESQHISFTSLIKKLGNRRMFKDEMITIHEKFLKGTVRRSEQVNALLSNAEQCKYPMVICGDFNDTPMSYTYYKLSRNRKDSFVEGGKGFSATYSFLWPLLRIDYVLHSESIYSDSHKIFKESYSDHYPVSTILYLNPHNDNKDHGR